MYACFLLSKLCQTWVLNVPQRNRLRLVYQADVTPGSKLRHNESTSVQNALLELKHEEGIIRTNQVSKAHVSKSSSNKLSANASRVV